MRYHRLLSITLLGGFLWGSVSEARAEYPYETTEAKVLDSFEIGLFENVGSQTKDEFYIQLDNSSNAGFTIQEWEDSGKWPKNNNVYLGTLCEGTFCLVDTRPYDGYATTFDLKVVFINTGEHAFRMNEVFQNDVAKAVRLVDKLNPDKNINLLVEDYSFTVSDKAAEENRFSVIVYGTELCAQSGKWTDASTWMSKKVPSGEIDYLIIEEDVEISIPSGAQVTIGNLRNHGVLINEGSLEIKNELKLSSN